MADRIFLAEDDDGITTMVRVLLESEGYSVQNETSGTEAWESIKKESPDLVILDWDIPGMNGLEILKQMRNHPETQNTPVIFLTGSRGEWDPRHSMLFQIEAYLTKPFQPNALLVEVKAALKLK